MTKSEVIKYMRDNNYIDDMEGCMIPRKYYPIIEEVIIRVVDDCRYELEFKTRLEYRG